MYAWSRSTFLPQLTPHALEIFARARACLPVAASSLEIMHLGGAIALKAPSDSAFYHR
jgi:hypothetical protein